MQRYTGRVSCGGQGVVSHSSTSPIRPGAELDEIAKPRSISEHIICVRVHRLLPLDDFFLSVCQDIIRPQLCKCAMEARLATKGPVGRVEYAVRLAHVRRQAPELTCRNQYCRRVMWTLWDQLSVSSRHGMPTLV